MKAISIKQPWANLIAQGLKTIETRTWETKHRGDLLIVASKNPKIEGIENYGVAVAVAELYAVTKFAWEHEEAACCKVYHGAFAWHLRNIREIKPFPVVGKLRLYNVTY